MINYDTMQLMNQAFIEIKNGLPINTDTMCAAEGYEQLGYRVSTFERTDILTDKYRLFYGTSPFVGSINTMKSLFRREGVEPSPIDFPAEMSLGRLVIQMPLSAAVDYFRHGGEVVFIKPVETKLFDGMLLQNFSGLHYFEPFLKDNPKCWVSPKMEVRSEFRGFVHRGELVDCRHYSGSFYLRPNYTFIEAAIEDYTVAPVAYTIDVAVNGEMETVVVECNDFWAIGSYGLEPKLYAQMLADRYFEVIND